MPLENIFLLLDDTLNVAYELKCQEVEGGIILINTFSSDVIYINLDETEELVNFLLNCIAKHKLSLE